MRPIATEIQRNASVCFTKHRINFEFYQQFLSNQTSDLHTGCHWIDSFEGFPMCPGELIELADVSDESTGSYHVSQFGTEFAKRVFYFFDRIARLDVDVSRSDGSSLFVDGYSSGNENECADAFGSTISDLGFPRCACVHVLSNHRSRLSKFFFM